MASLAYNVYYFIKPQQNISGIFKKKTCTKCKPFLLDEFLYVTLLGINIIIIINCVDKKNTYMQQIKYLRWYLLSRGDNRINNPNI